MQFGTNHLGHFLLTELLTPLIVQSAKDAKDGEDFRPRIVIVSSGLHKKGKLVLYSRSLLFD